jgi:hypothetical protein
VHVVKLADFPDTDSDMDKYTDTDTDKDTDMDTDTDIDRDTVIFTSTRKLVSLATNKWCSRVST